MSIVPGSEFEILLSISGREVNCVIRPLASRGLQRYNAKLRLTRTRTGSLRKSSRPKTAGGVVRESDMRRPLWGLALGLTFFLLSPSYGRVQTVVNQTLGGDPFALYYGWYLPNQAYQAAQPSPQDTLNANAVARQ